MVHRGDFTVVGGLTRNHIAHILPDGNVDPPRDPSPNNSITCLYRIGSTLYASGNFATIGGASRNLLAALDPTDGSATAWNPNIANYVNGAVVMGGNLYLGGGFTQIGGQSRNYLGAVSLDTGAVQNFNPNLNQTVSCLLPVGSSLIVGGNFSSIGGVDHYSLARFDDPTLIRLAHLSAQRFKTRGRIRWETSMEQNVAGFHLHRSLRESSERIRLTSALIPARGEMGARYEWLDRELPPDQGYEYILEEITQDGVSILHGPIRLEDKITSPIEDVPGFVYASKDESFVSKNIGFVSFFQVGTKEVVLEAFLDVEAFMEGNQAAATLRIVDVGHF